MTTQASGVSFFPDDLPDGGGAPIGRYRIQDSRFADFNYGGIAPMGTALKLTLLGASGTTQEQHYSCGPKERVNHTPDGKFLTAMPTKTTNFGILMTEMINSGLPADILKSGDITKLVGLDADWDHKEPPPTGDASITRRPISVPTRIHALPGAPAATAPPAAVAPPPPPPPPPPAVAPAAAPPAPPPAPEAAAAPAPAPPVDNGTGEADNVAALIEGLRAGGKLNPDENGAVTFTRQDMLVQAYTQFESDATVRDAMGSLVFDDRVNPILISMGYAVDGMNVTLAATG